MVMMSKMRQSYTIIWGARMTDSITANSNNLGDDHQGYR